VTWQASRSKSSNPSGNSTHQGSVYAPVSTDRFASVIYDLHHVTQSYLDRSRILQRRHRMRQRTRLHNSLWQVTSMFAVKPLTDDSSFSYEKLGPSVRGLTQKISLCSLSFEVVVRTYNERLICYPNVTTLRSDLCCRTSVRLFVVCLSVCRLSACL